MNYGSSLTFLGPEKREVLFGKSITVQFFIIQNQVTTELEKMIMFELPDYEIIIWIVGNEFGKKLENDILSTIDIKSYESVNYEGVFVHRCFISNPTS
ncbi:hypothetical protein ACFLZG_05725 [Thermodesulfobacteriota bacterium]